MPSESPTRPDVMLLAAGRGTRMKPLTDALPKPLIKVAGIPLLDRAVAAAQAEGFSHFVVNVHHHAERLAAHVDALAVAHPGLRFRVSPEAEPLDTGGGLKRALPLLDGDPLLVMNTDVFWPPRLDRPLEHMLARHDKGDADIVLLCAQPRRAVGFRRSHDFCLDPRGRITRDFGQPIIYAGALVIRRDKVEAVVDERFSLYRLFEAALDGGRLAGVVLDAPWFHVGDPAALAEAEEILAAVAR